MQFGATMFVTDYSIPVTELARALEDLGFESLWVPEHTHIPTSRTSPWPGGPELPKEYLHSLDPFLALSAAASVTSTLKLGTGVCLVIERDTIATAKEVATLDYLSGGRFLFGIGGGWNLEEMANHGTDPSTRWSRMREQIQAMKQIWSHDEAEYHGKLVDFDPIWQWPKPIQQPHPPIIIGGNGPHTLRRVLEYGDGWIPILGRGQSLEERLPELTALTREAGRPPIPVTIWGTRPDPAFIETMASLGATRCVFALPSAGAEEILPRLKHYAEVMKVAA
jgi:probable F420-dependent oxidoreductase